MGRIRTRFGYRISHVVQMLMRAHILAVALGVCHLSGAQSSSGQALSTTDAALLNQALAKRDAGDLQASEPMLQALVLRHPNHYVINEAMGGLYAESGDSARSLPYLMRAVRLSPHQALAHANLGATYLKMKQTDLAIRELQLAARLDAKNFVTLANLGEAEMQANQPAAAAEAFQAAEKLNPSDPDTLYNWALALQSAKSVHEAAAVLQRVPRESRTAETESLGGELAEQLGDFKAAVLFDQTAARLDPSADNLYALTVELLRHWTWIEALTISRSAQLRFPNDTRFALATGIALYADEKYGEAAGEFSLLLNREPENAVYADLLGRSCEASGDDALAACRELDAFLSVHPQNARLATLVAAHILRSPLDQQDTPRAEALLRQAISADASLPEAYFQLAVLEQQSTHWKESVPLLGQAISLRPSYAEAHFRLSRAYAHLGRRDDALHEIALQQQYSQAEKDRLNGRMQEIVRFVLTPEEKAASR